MPVIYAGPTAVACGCLMSRRDTSVSVEDGLVFSETLLEIALPHEISLKRLLKTLTMLIHGQETGLRRKLGSRKEARRP
jgi:hypothetical protein